MGIAEYCKDCLFILKSTHACPRPQVFQEGDSLAILLEILWVLGSFLPFFVFIVVAFYSLGQKTSRGFSIFSLLFAQHLVCETMKRFYPEDRPEGSCATSSAFPSTHATFVGCLSTWLFLEMLLLNKKAPFKRWKYYTTWRNLFFIFSLIVPLARYNLNYHTFEQIFYGLFTGALGASGYFIFMIISVVYQNVEGYRRSMLAKLWKKLKLCDNYTYFKQDEDKRALLELKELQKKAESVSKLKNDLKAQRDELAKRVNFLQQQKNSKR